MLDRLPPDVLPVISGMLHGVDTAHLRRTCRALSGVYPVALSTSGVPLLPPAQRDVVQSWTVCDGLLDEDEVGCKLLAPHLRALVLKGCTFPPTTAPVDLPPTLESIRVVDSDTWGGTVGRRLFRWFDCCRERLHVLRHLDMSNNNMIIRGQDYLRLLGIPSLRSLNIAHNVCILDISPSAVPPHSLQELDLTGISVYSSRILVETILAGRAPWVALKVMDIACPDPETLAIDEDPVGGIILRKCREQLCTPHMQTLHATLRAPEDVEAVCAMVGLRHADLRCTYGALQGMSSNASALPATMETLSLNMVGSYTRHAPAASVLAQGLMANCTALRELSMAMWCAAAVLDFVRGIADSAPRTLDLQKWVLRSCSISNVPGFYRVANAAFPRLRSLSTMYHQDPGGWVEHANAFPCLRRLNLHCARVFSHDMLVLARHLSNDGLPLLESLDVSNTNIGDAGFDGFGELWPRRSPHLRSRLSRWYMHDTLMSIHCTQAVLNTLGGIAACSLLHCQDSILTLRQLLAGLQSPPGLIYVPTIIALYQPLPPEWPNVKTLSDLDEEMN